MQDFKYFSDLHDLHALHGSKIFTMKQHGGHEVKCRYVRCFSDLHALELHGLNAGIFQKNLILSDDNRSTTFNLQQTGGHDSLSPVLMLSGALRRS